MIRRNFIAAFPLILFAPLAYGLRFSDLNNVVSSMPNDGALCLIYSVDHNIFLGGPLPFRKVPGGWIETHGAPPVASVWFPKPKGIVTHWTLWEK